jgi:hypothetical protein
MTAAVPWAPPTSLVNRVADVGPNDGNLYDTGHGIK